MMFDHSDKQLDMDSVFVNTLIDDFAIEVYDDDLSELIKIDNVLSISCIKCGENIVIYSSDSPRLRDFGVPPDVLVVGVCSNHECGDGILVTTDFFYVGDDMCPECGMDGELECDYCGFKDEVECQDCGTVYEGNNIKEVGIDISDRVFVCLPCKEW